MSKAYEDIFAADLFRPSAGFMDAPVDYDLNDCRLAILGLPFDCGTHRQRIGARQGPDAIRQQSLLLDTFYPSFSDADPFTELNVIDCGDVLVTPGRNDFSFAQMQTAANRIAAAGARILALGGDSSISLAMLRALRSIYPDIALLHFDARTDTQPLDQSEYISTATTFACAAEERLLDVENSFHIGARGPSALVDILEYTRDSGYQVISGDELFEHGIESTLARLHETLTGRPVYLSWDMSFFDPACAPGICEPSWGGPNTREALDLLEGLAGLNFIGMDINGLSPPHDPHGMSAHLAANVALIGLHLACYEAV